MKEIKVGFWGYGGIAKTHMEAIALMNVRYPSMSRVVPETLCTRKIDENKKQLFKHVTSDKDEMLKDESISIIDVPSPNYVHYEQALDCIKYGKAIYMEKPLTINLNDSLSLIKLVEEKKILNRVAFIYRFIPSIAAMRDLINSGEIGDIIHFNMRMYHDSYLNPEKLMTWRQQKEFAGGGSIVDLGIHLADLVQWFFGPVDKVYAQDRIVNKARYKDKDKTEIIENDTDEFCSASIEMESGVIGTLESSRVSSHVDSGTTIHVFGTKGALYFDADDTGKLLKKDNKTGVISTITSFKNAGDYSRYLSTLVSSSKAVGYYINAHMGSIKSIIDTYDGTSENPCAVDFKQAYLAQRIVEMIMKSCQEHRVVTKEEFPLDKEYFK